MLRPSPNHGTQRLPNDDDDDGLKARRSMSTFLFLADEVADTMSDTL